MKRLLLVGGGQAHAFVLRALAASPRRDVEVVLATPSDRLVYSGMLPWAGSPATTRSPS